ncbi:MAG: ABC transporter ATP-binding protein [Acidimicrobiia bacterium]
MTPNAAVNGSQPADVLVQLESVAVAFGGLRAIDGVDVAVARGERLVILGPNGAGKTTLFNVIAGDITPTEGTVTIRGIDCTHLPSRLRPRLGVSRTYQRTRLFDALTVEDNLYLAQTGKYGSHYGMWRTGHDQECREHAHEVAAQVWLGDDINSLVSDLSHGQRRQLEIGMAVASRSEILMLDEPASGLSKGERERLLDLLHDLPSQSTLLLIEHDMDVALRIAERVVVMADGVIVASGTPDEIRQDPLVHAIYLGREGAA